MAEENKSQLISEAELIEAINADSLVSISLGAGQAQKNVKLSTLASVVAGLISFPFDVRGAGVSADTNLASGIYQNPTSAPYSYGQLIVFNSGGVITEIFVSTEPKYYIRSLSVSGWTTWKQIA